MATVLDPPTAATSRPGTPEEQALRAAWQAAGDLAVQSAERLAAAASEALERQALTLATAGRVTELKNLLAEVAGLVAVHHYLASLAAGEEPEPPTRPNVSAELVRCYIGADPRRYARLISKAETETVNAEDRIGKAEARLNICCEEFAVGRDHLVGFVGAYTLAATARAANRERVARLRSAIERAQAGLQRTIGEALGPLPDLRISAREALAWDKGGDPGAEEKAELESVQGQLARLGLDGDQAKAGMLGSALRDREKELIFSRKARKREAIGRFGTSAAELVDRAQAAEPAALVELIAIIKTVPLAFSAGLGARIAEVMADALAEPGCADVFAELILS
jgi:hypothetical protein